MSKVRFTKKILERVKLLSRRRRGGKKPSLRQIAFKLNSGGISAPCGGLWYPANVARAQAAAAAPVIEQSRKVVIKTSLGINDYLTLEPVGAGV